MKRGIRVVIIVGMAVLPLVFSGSVLAARYTSSNYLIDASVDDSFGGQQTSANYRMVDAGGEAIVGNGTSGSYKIGMGYMAQLIKAIQVSVDQAAVTFPSVIAGVPQTAGINVATQTDAPGYSLSIVQNGDLSDGAGHAIPPVSGTISAPIAWADGTTKGFGFTITSAYGGVPSPWNGGNSYAQFPNAGMVFYTRGGQFSGTDTTALRFKIDVAPDQVSGTYTNTITVTGTMTP